MKPLNLFSFLGISILALLVVTAGCEPTPQSPDDYYNDDNFTVKLSADKAPGHGQYEYRAESSDAVNIDVEVVSPSPLVELRITKTKNVEVDSSFGTSGAMTVDVSESSFTYQFNYVPDTTDIDALVGFSFEAVNVDGESETSDLTLSVTLSPRDNMTRVRWELTSIRHVNKGNEEVIEDCNDGYALLLNADSTMTKSYGEEACGLDGLNEYDKWYFTEDEQQLVMESHNVFAPDTPVIETFKVKTLTTEELGLELTVDLTELGEGIETFLYTYEATLR